MKKYCPIRMYVDACKQISRPHQTVTRTQHHGCDGDYDLRLADGSRVTIWPAMSLVILEDWTQVQVSQEASK